MKPSASATCVVRARAAAFPHGRTSITREGRAAGSFDTRMDFDIVRMKRGERHEETARKESAWILLSGRVDIVVDGTRTQLRRASLFDEAPSAVHAGQGGRFAIRALAQAEWAVVRTTNPRRLPVRIYHPGETASEDRGAGLAQGACRRLVRTIFDYSTRPDSNLVIGEVVNFPGRWSTYPPHHHDQPEIYHYRFTLPQGYGHSEVGESVFKIYNGDTVKIPGGLDHAQVSAPGYGMYYLWLIRHLPRRPYRGFEFTQAHRWLLDPRRQGWQPQLPEDDPA